MLIFLFFFVVSCWELFVGIDLVGRFFNLILLIFFDLVLLFCLCWGGLCKFKVLIILELGWFVNCGKDSKMLRVVGLDDDWLFGGFEF